MQEERQAHAKASQQQLGKQAIEVQNGQQRTPGATPTASTLTAPTPTAPITPVEDPVQVHPLTFPPVFSLLFPNHLCLTQLFN